MLARLTTYSNNINYQYRWSAQKDRINVYQVEQWYVYIEIKKLLDDYFRYMSDWERMNELYTYRTGYLKLAPIQLSAPQSTVAPQLLSGYVLKRIFLYTVNLPYSETPKEGSLYRIE